MNPDGSYRLVGSLDAWEAGIGFFIPFFSHPRANALFIQNVDPNGRITSFTPIELPSDAYICLPERQVSIEDQAVWSFVFGPDDIIVGQGQEEKGKLAVRLGDIFFRERPLLALEVSEFVNEPTTRVRFARSAFERFATASNKSANVWRDISILTPDVVSALSSLPRSQTKYAIPDLTRVVTTTESDQILVRGINIGSARAANIDAIINCIKSAYSRLEELYADKLVKFPRIVFASPHIPSPAPIEWHGDAKAILVIEDPQLDWLRYRFADNPALAIHAYLASEMVQGAAYLRSGERPIFTVAQLGREPRHRSSLFRAVHLSLQYRRPGPLGQRDQMRMADLPRPSVLIDARRNTSSPAAERATAETISDVITVLLGKSGDGGPRHSIDELRHFIQAPGTGPKPDLDAWCQLYNRLWRLDLIGGHGFRFDLNGPLAFDEDQSIQPVIDAMFPGLERWTIPAPVSHVARRGKTVAVLVSPAHASKLHQPTIHRNAVAMLLQQQGWRVRDQERMKNPLDPLDAMRALKVDGRYDSFECATYDHESELNRMGSDDRYLEIDPTSVSRIVATELAGPDEILARLVWRGELLATVGDLSLCAPERGAIPSALAAQARRFMGLRPSTARAQYLAMLTNNALANRSTYTDHEISSYTANAIRKYIHDPAFGRSLSLGYTRIIFEKMRVVAHLKGIHGYGDARHKGVSNDEISTDLKFQLVFDRKGIHVSAIESRHR